MQLVPHRFVVQFIRSSFLEANQVQNAIYQVSLILPTLNRSCSTLSDLSVEETIHGLERRAILGSEAGEEEGESRNDGQDGK